MLFSAKMTGGGEGPIVDHRDILARVIAHSVGSYGIAEPPAMVVPGDLDPGSPAVWLGHQSPGPSALSPRSAALR